MNALQFLILIFGIDSLMLSHLFFNEISRYFQQRKARKKRHKYNGNTFEDLEIR